MFSALKSRIMGTPQPSVSPPKQTSLQPHQEVDVLYTFNTNSTKDDICDAQLNVEHKTKIEGLIQSFERSIPRNSNNIQRKKKLLIQNFKNIIYLNHDIKNMILFFLRKGTSGLLQGERKVEIKIEYRGIQEPIMKIYFKDLEFKFSDILFISSYTPFLSYKQLKSLKEDRSNKYIIHKLMDIVTEKGITRSEKNINSFEQFILQLENDKFYLLFKKANSNNNSNDYEYFFSAYNTFIIQSHQSGKVRLINKALRKGSLVSIEEMICDFDSILTFEKLERMVLEKYKKKLGKEEQNQQKQINIFLSHYESFSRKLIEGSLNKIHQIIDRKTMNKLSPQDKESIDKFLNHIANQLLTINQFLLLDKIEKNTKLEITELINSIMNLYESTNNRLSIRLLVRENRIQDIESLCKSIKNKLNIESLLNINQENENIESKLSTMYTHVDEEFYNLKVLKKVEDRYYELNNQCIQYIIENKLEILTVFNNLYQRFNQTFGKNEKFIGDSDEPMDIYKNFIRIMVLALNRPKTKYLLENTMENHLELDTFYRFFLPEINKIDGFYDIDINQIDNDDYRLNDHIYSFGKYILNLNNIRNIRFDNETYTSMLSVDLNKLEINFEGNINYNQLFVFKNIRNGDKIRENLFKELREDGLNPEEEQHFKINLYSIFNLFYSNFLKTNGFDIFYYDLTFLLKKIFNDPRLYEDMEYIDYYLYILKMLDGISRQNIVGTGYTPYIVGTDNPEREIPSLNRANTYFLQNVFSEGKINILETFILGNKDTPNPFKIFGVFINMNLVAFIASLFTIEKINKIQNIIKIIGYLEFADLMKNKITINKLIQEANNHMLNLDKISYSFNLSIERPNDFPNEYLIMAQIKRIEYLFEHYLYKELDIKKDYLLFFIRSKLNVYELGPYYNLMGYPLLFNIENNKYFDKNIKYRQMFREIQQTFLKDGQPLINLVNGVVLERIKQLLNNKELTLQNIYQRLIHVFSHIDICLFFQYFLKNELLNVENLQTLNLNEKKQNLFEFINRSFTDHNIQMKNIDDFNIDSLERKISRPERPNNEENADFVYQFKKLKKLRTLYQFIVLIDNVERKIPGKINRKRITSHKNKTLQQITNEFKELRKQISNSKNEIRNIIIKEKYSQNFLKSLKNKSQLNQKMKTILEEYIDELNENGIDIESYINNYNLIEQIYLVIKEYENFINKKKVNYVKKELIDINHFYTKVKIYRMLNYLNTVNVQQNVLPELNEGELVEAVGGKSKKKKISNKRISSKKMKK